MLAAAAVCYAHPYAPAVSSQYISQDNHGSYAYGYSDPNSQKHESRSADGVTHGGYSYVDGHGHIQSVKYTADPVHGFQVAGTNLPVGPAPVHPVHAAYHAAPAAVSYAHHASPLVYAAPWAHSPISINAHGVPHDTPEVAAAKLQHAAAHAEANAQHHHLWKRSLWGGHQAAAWSHAAAPVQIHNGVPVDTPEVQHAKAAHFAAVAEAQSRDAHHGGHYAAGHYDDGHYAAAPVHSGAYHIPVIHNGVPVETPEVQHAKAAHFAAVAEASARSGHGHGGYHGDGGGWAAHSDDGHWDGNDGQHHQW